MPALSLAELAGAPPGLVTDAVIEGNLPGASLVGSFGYVFDPRENRTKGLKLSPAEFWLLLKALGVEFEH